VPPCSAYPESGFTPSQDSWITYNNPYLAFPEDPVLRIHPNVNQLRRTLILFDLGSIPPGSTITKATLFLNDEAGGEYTIQIHEIARSWIEAVTWQTQPSHDEQISGSFPLTPSICVRSAYLDTGLVSAWVDNPATNFGILLKSTTGNGEAQFSSSESAVPPRLVVEYSLP
jgi:hypothetical protein